MSNMGGYNKGDLRIQPRKRRACFGSTSIWFRVKCTCGLSGPWCSSIKEAILDWNKINFGG